MKKFYMLIAFAFVTATLLLSFSSTLQAQCPVGPQKVFRIVGFNLTSAVYVEGFQPNGNIALWDGITAIPNQNPPSSPAVTDANGNGTIIYDGNLNPTAVTVSTILGTCNQDVPAKIPDCTGDLSNNGPIIPPVGSPYCNVFLVNSLPNGEVRVFDGALNLIPTFTGNFINTDADGAAGYPYDCANLATSLTVCNGTGCCSYLMPGLGSLPIKLKYFTAKLSNNKDVILNWASEFELASDKFVVEKSLDGRNFKSIGDVKSAGASTTLRSYAFTDGSFSAVAYYRLKMVDIDGKTEFSKVVYVNVRGGNGVVTQIFPNPFKTDIQIIGISSTDLNSKNVKVYGATGQQVNFKITGANAISLDEHAPSGLYILVIKEQRFKLIKE